MLRRHNVFFVPNDNSNNFMEWRKHELLTRHFSIDFIKCLTAFSFWVSLCYCGFTKQKFHLGPKIWLYSHRSTLKIDILFVNSTITLKYLIILFSSVVFVLLLHCISVVLQLMTDRCLDDISFKWSLSLFAGKYRFLYSNSVIMINYFLFILLPQRFSQSI